MPLVEQRLGGAAPIYFVTWFKLDEVLSERPFDVLRKALRQVLKDREKLAMAGATVGRVWNSRAAAGTFGQAYAWAVR